MSWKRKIQQNKMIEYTRTLEHVLFTFIGVAATPRFRMWITLTIWFEPNPNRKIRSRRDRNEENEELSSVWSAWFGWARWLNWIETEFSFQWFEPIRTHPNLAELFRCSGSVEIGSYVLGVQSASKLKISFVENSELQSVLEHDHFILFLLDLDMCIKKLISKEVNGPTWKE